MSDEKQAKTANSSGALLKPCDVMERLCRTMTVTSEPIGSTRDPPTRTSVTLRALILFAGANRLERIDLARHRPNGWELFITRAKQSAARYSLCISALKFELDGALATNGLIGLDLRGLTVPLQKESSSEDALYRQVTVLFPVLGGAIPTTPLNMCMAIQRKNVQGVKNAIASGVSVNSTWRVPILESALCALSSSYSGVPSAPWINSLAIFELITSQPDIDWDVRADHGATMLERTLGVDMGKVHHLLPWGKIDLDACNDQGDNILHSCCRHGAGTLDEAVSDRILEFIHILMLHGAERLTICRNNYGDRPSEVVQLPDFQSLLRRMEEDGERTVSTCLLQVIGISALVRVVVDYF